MKARRPETIPQPTAFFIIFFFLRYTNNSFVSSRALYWCISQYVSYSYCCINSINSTASEYSTVQHSTVVPHLCSTALTAVAFLRGLPSFTQDRCREPRPRSFVVCCLLFAVCSSRRVVPRSGRKNESQVPKLKDQVAIDDFDALDIRVG